MSNINLLKDKDANCFIIYFYFALFLYLLSLWFSWVGIVNIVKKYNILWQFDEVLYAYIVWPFFSLLNLFYITFKNNKVKLYFSVSLIIFLYLISTYFILNIENIYKINFPEQFFSLYLNSIIFVTAIISTFILFAIILFKNIFNKHNFILINSYFFLIILFIAMLFIIINKPKSPFVSDYPYLPSIIMSLHGSSLFLFIPFLNFLFLILIYFFKKHKIIFIIITAIVFWDMLLGLITGLLSALEAFLLSILFFVLFATIYKEILMPKIKEVNSYKEKNNSLIQTIFLFNLIALLIYLGLSSHEFDPVIIDPAIPVPLYKLDPVYDLASSIIIIILFLILVNLAIYLKGKSALKTLK